MNTINIEKLEELINEKWDFNKKNFKLKKSYMVGATVVLHMLNNKENTNGKEEDKAVFWVNEKNYKELEFYGLKVVLNEKPKLTREERDFLKCIDMDEIYIARDEDGGIYCFLQLPKIMNDYWSRNDHNGIYCFRIFENLFSFITWESGKAWSKSELMKLKVIDQKGSINNVYLQTKR